MNIAIGLMLAGLVTGLIGRFLLNWHSEEPQPPIQAKVVRDWREQGIR